MDRTQNKDWANRPFTRLLSLTALSGTLLIAPNAFAEDPPLPPAPATSSYGDQGMVRQPSSQPYGDVGGVKPADPVPYADPGMVAAPQNPSNTPPEDHSLLAPTEQSNALTPGKRPPNSVRVEALDGDFKLDITGFARMRFALAEGDSKAPFVGRNNGFNIGNARFAITAGYKEKLFVRLQLEGGVDRNILTTSSVGQLQLGLRDAFIAYQPWDFLRITVGQFKAPFDAESLADLNDVMFISRAVYVDGVRGTEGFFVPGLGVDRELGLRLSGERLKLSDKIAASYFFAVTNGNADNATVNDNNHPAVWGRAELYVPFTRIGAAVNFNHLTSGVFPNLFDEQRLGVAADLKFEWKGAFFFAQFMMVQSAFPTTKAPKTVAMGAHAQVGYKFWFGLTPAYRIAWYEPNDRIGIDQLLYHTVGLMYDVPVVPLRVMVNGTLAGEQTARSIANNQIDFLVQATFP